MSDELRKLLGYYVRPALIDKAEKEVKQWAISKKPKELNNNRDYNFVSYNLAIADYVKNLEESK